MRLPTDKQEIFDTVAVHLLTQNAKSLAGNKAIKNTSFEDNCLYRNDFGQKCAIGCLIPDELYDTGLEYHSAYELVQLATDLIDDPEIFKPFIVWDTPEVRDLLCDLQGVHDVEKIEDWPTELARVAFEYKLNTDKLEEVVNK